MSVKNAVEDVKLVAACGLYCGSCGKYLNSKCPGCKENKKASWCGVRSCVLENSYASCGDCAKIELKDCKKFNNFIGKVFGFIFNSDRAACINKIKESGYDKFAKEMTETNRMTIKRK
jgi:hypothetical protein